MALAGPPNPLLYSKKNGLIIQWIKLSLFKKIKVFFERTRVSRVARAGIFEKLINGSQTSDAARRKQETEYLGRKAREDGTPLRLTKDKRGKYCDILYSEVI